MSATPIVIPHRMPLIKWSVVRELTGLRRDEIFDRVDGSSLLHRGFAWVWDVSAQFEVRSAECGVRNVECGRRDLRFWRAEVLMEQSLDSSKHGKYSNWELDWVIAQILPARRMTFHSGEVQMLFDLNRKTFMALRDELNGNMAGARNVVFARTSLVRFLERRWLGAVAARPAAICQAGSARGADRTAVAAPLASAIPTTDFHPANPEERDNGVPVNGDKALARSPKRTRVAAPDVSSAAVNSNQ